MRRECPEGSAGETSTQADISVPIRWTRPLPWAGRGHKHAERFRVLLLLDLSTPEDSYALCGIWANSKFFLLARSRRADRVGQQASGLLRPEYQAGFRSHLRSCYKHGFVLRGRHDGGVDTLLPMRVECLHL